VSGIYVSSGTHEVHVVAHGAKATINTLNHTISLNARGCTIFQVQASTTEQGSQVRMRATPFWLAWLFGERLTVKVRLR
jgi:hypothetical protein